MEKGKQKIKKRKSRNIMELGKIVFSREQLYDLLWKEPAITLLKKYNINYSGLKKICAEMKIPLPQNGYWQKIKFGKNVEIKPLPLDYSGEQEVTLILKEEGEQNNLNLLNPKTILQKRIENDEELSLVVPDRLTNPHKLIIAAKERLNQKHDYLHNGLINTWGEVLNIRVEPNNVGRALRFMNALIKNLEKRNHKVIVENGTYVIIENEKIKIGLREKLKRTAIQGKYSWEQYQYNPTGILIFSIEISYRNIEWKDGKVPLEKQLAKIIAGLELKAKETKEERLKIEKFWTEQREKDRIKQEIEQQKQKEISAFKELLKDAEQWNQVKNLRNYVDTIEAKAISTNTLSEKLKGWIDWARKKADSYDPLLIKDNNLFSNQ
jgi:hypothetical protein